MKELFRIQTNMFVLAWEQVGTREPSFVGGDGPNHGCLRIKPRNRHLLFEEGNFRSDVQSSIAADPTVEFGPRLFEETDYQVYARTVNPNFKLTIVHRDPSLLQRITYRDNQSTAYGVINFRGQIGRSVFTVLINDKPQLDFEVEVFPTKLDYFSDYKQLLAQVQEILTSLAYEYLRSTFQLGKLDTTRKPSRLEWLILLEQLVGKLEQALHFIAHKPSRSLTRMPRSSRIDRIRRVDNAVRSQVRRGAGRGILQRTAVGPVRTFLDERPATPTLDTPEHRWLKRNLTSMRQTLGILSKRAAIDIESSRSTQMTNSLQRMERRINGLLRLEPMQASQGEVATEFASLQLVSAPGYREAYQACLLLRFGLRLEGDLYQLSVKDINVLYEYWVFLQIVELLRDPALSGAEFKDLFKLSENRLNIRLREGAAQSVRCVNSKERKVIVTYNYQYQRDDFTLIPQKPDVLIRFQQSGWPQMILVCDAKYRVDASEDYVQQFKSAGPPPDAINVLHRYRDAILDNEETRRSPGTRKQHVVVQAVAAFPLSDSADQPFEDSRLWQSISRIGVGAVPALPTNTRFLRKWLTSGLTRGGWQLADQVIPHMAEIRAADWRIAADQTVLVGTLRNDDPPQHLDWIESTLQYYTRFSKTQAKQLEVRQVAIYLPRSLGGHIKKVADVVGTEIVMRREIATPWTSERGPDQQTVLYHLSPFRDLKQPVRFHPSENTSIRQPRWTTRLGLERAKILSEIALGSEPEWRLYETLTAGGFEFSINSMQSRKTAPDNPNGWAEFHLSDKTVVRFDGINGYTVKKSDGHQRFAKTSTQVLKLLK